MKRSMNRPISDAYCTYGLRYGFRLRFTAVHRTMVSRDSPLCWRGGHATVTVTRLSISHTKHRTAGSMVRPDGAATSLTLPRLAHVRWPEHPGTNLALTTCEKPKPAVLTSAHWPPA
eukprot:5590122-Prymnesium_polylepis.2